MVDRTKEEKAHEIMELVNDIGGSAGPRIARGILERDLIDIIEGRANEVSLWTLEFVQNTTLSLRTSISSSKSGPMKGIMNDSEAALGRVVLAIIDAGLAEKPRRGHEKEHPRLG